MGKNKLNGQDCTEGMSEKDRKRLFDNLKKILGVCRKIGDKKFELSGVDGFKCDKIERFNNRKGNKYNDKQSNKYNGKKNSTKCGKSNKCDRDNDRDKSERRNKDKSEKTRCKIKSTKFNN